MRISDWSSDVCSSDLRLGVQLDLRRTTALFDARYSGWQGGLYVTYEQALSPILLVSMGPFVRRDRLNERAFSTLETGVTDGIGCAIPTGINFGLRTAASRAVNARAFVFL